MKKQLLLCTAVLLATAGSLMAQQAIQEKAPNARTKEAIFALQSGIGLSNEQLIKAYPIFEDFYTADQKAREEMKASGTLTSEETERSWKILSEARDERLAVIFTEGQMKKLKETPSLFERSSVTK